MTLPYLAFVVFFSNLCESFLITFQSDKPLIHLLFHGMSTLLTTILQSIVNKKCLYVNDEGVAKKLKPIADLVMIDLHKKENLKSAKLIEIGTKARSLIQDSLLLDSDIATFRSSCRICYVEAASYLQVNLPFNNKVLEYAQFLHPQKRNDRLSLNSIANLALKITNVFGPKSYQAFNVSSDKSPADILIW